MTPLGLANLVRLRTRTNTTTFSDADMLVYANTFKDEIASKIVERNNGMYLVPYTFNLVADRREYPVGDDVLNRIHKVEIKFAAADARKPAYSLKDYRGSETESEIVKNFSNREGEFAYTVRRRAILILSGTIIAVTDGVRMWSHVFPADITSMTFNDRSMEVDPSTTTFGFPKQFHELLARRIQIAYKGSLAKPLPLSREELQYDRDLELALEAIASIDNGGEIIAELPPSQDMYNDGWDL